MTIEDPIEYKMDVINQIQVNNKAGLTFEKGLRAILRQDPDIIMVGEIRDVETAKIAVRAAITGHLVISTLHTNDAVSSIARLIDMEIPPYLLNASLIGVVSQRLVRKVCGTCSNEVTISEDNGENTTTLIPIGCPDCSGNGYLGRTAVYEILEINDDRRDAIKNKKEGKEQGVCKNMIKSKANSKGTRDSIVIKDSNCDEINKKYNQMLEGILYFTIVLNCDD